MSFFLTQKIDNLRQFCQWFVHRFDKHDEDESVFLTCLCGHFHSYPQAMQELLKLMQKQGLISVKNHNVTII